MTSRSYSGALTELLEPVGFERTGSDWIRITGQFQETINLQKSGMGGGVTVNVRSADLVYRQIVSDAVGTPRFDCCAQERIGTLCGLGDVWWKNDPNGPNDVAQKVRDCVLPFLETLHSLDEQAKRFGIERFIRGDWGQRDFVVELAITLHRLGREKKLVCEALDVPRRRHEIPRVIDDIRAVRRYFKCPPTENWPDP